MDCQSPLALSSRGRNDQPVDAPGSVGFIPPRPLPKAAIFGARRGSFLALLSTRIAMPKSRFGGRFAVDVDGVADVASVVVGRGGVVDG